VVDRRPDGQLAAGPAGIFLRFQRIFVDTSLHFQVVDVIFNLCDGLEDGAATSAGTGGGGCGETGEDRHIGGGGDGGEGGGGERRDQLTLPVGLVLRPPHPQAAKQHQQTEFWPHLDR